MKRRLNIAAAVIHDLERLCDRIAIVDAGKLLALGTLNELLAEHGGPPPLIVRINGEEQRLQTADPLAELNRIAARSPIDRFQMERPTMEQVFLWQPPKIIAKDVRRERTGKTEQTASGAAWAMLMPLSMIGGAMVPTFVMPAWIQSIGFISPIRRTMLAIEGGVWRNFSLGEMVTPCAILISVGLACFAIGTRGLKEA